MLALQGRLDWRLGGVTVAVGKTKKDCEGSWAIFQGEETRPVVNSEKDAPEIAHVLEMMVIMDMLLQIGADAAQAYMSMRTKQFFRHYSIEHVTDMLCNLINKHLWEI